MPIRAAAVQGWTFAIAVWLSPLAACAQPSPCAARFPGGTPPSFVNLKLAQGVTLLCNDAFADAASPITRGGVWSAEHLTAASLDAARQIPREGEFHRDERLAAGSRGELEDYRDSGYDRGHLAPSGDMPTARAQQQSFSLANMVPQTPELNRAVWERIESAVRRLAEDEGELYVVTGPAFTGRNIASIGPDGVLVPTATWKAVYDPRVPGAGAYACSNTRRPICRTISVAALTSTVGIDPFPAVPTSIKARLMPLPAPGGVPESHGRRRSRLGFFDRLLTP